MRLTPTNQYAPGAPMADERMDGNALVTTKIARVEREAIIPARTWKGVLEISKGSFFKHIFSSPCSQIYITRGSFHILLGKHLSSPCSQVEEALQEKPTEVDQSQLLVLLSIIIIVYNYQLTRASSYFIINYHYCS